MHDKTKLLGTIICCLVFIGMLLPAAVNPVASAQTPSPWDEEDNWNGSYDYGDDDDDGDRQPPPPPDFVDPAGRLNAFDPDEAADIRFDFPPNAVSVPIEIKAFYTALPANVPPPPNGMVGDPFYFGAWIRGTGEAVPLFNQSITIKVFYDQNELSSVLDKNVRGQASAQEDETDLSSVPGNNVQRQAPAQEEDLNLTMYDPTTESWLKLCNRTDSGANKLAAALVVPTPIQENENALFALTIDDTPALNQRINSQGNTVISIPDNNFRLNILPGTVEVGAFFEITRLPTMAEAGSLRLLPTPVDLKACRADYTRPNAIRQITQFLKPLNIEFGYTADAESRAGGKFNLTIAIRQNRQWQDVEELDYPVSREANHINVDSRDLGAFGLAAQSGASFIETPPEAIFAEGQTESNTESATTTSEAQDEATPSESEDPNSLLPVTGETFANNSFVLPAIFALLVMSLLVGTGLWKISRRW